MCLSLATREHKVLKKNCRLKGLCLAPLFFAIYVFFRGHLPDPRGRLFVCQNGPCFKSHSQMS
jgi:hypothetical protein